jgi:hypothetical protein
MSETVLKILLGELTTVRVVCKQCGSALEVTLAQAATRQPSEPTLCPGCGTCLRPVGAGGDDLQTLAEVLQRLGQRTAFDVQFVVPVKKDPPTP